MRHLKEPGSPRISSGLTNEVNSLNRGIAGCMNWAFSKIGIQGTYMYDDKLVKSGELGIIVPEKVVKIQDTHE